MSKNRELGELGEIVTVNTAASSIQVGNTSIHSTGITVGNTSIHTSGITVSGQSINNTSFPGTANNTSFVGSVSAANVVSNAQLSSNLSNYQTTAGLNANIASYLPTYTGVVNGASHTVGSAFTANSTMTNTVSLVVSTNTVTIGTAVYFVANGNVGINTTNPTQKLYVDGGSIGFAASTNNAGQPWLMGGNAWNGSGPSTTSVTSISGMAYSGNSGSQLFTFSSGPGVMSLQADGSIFAGEGPATYNPFSINGASGGCLYVYNNATVGGLMGIGGNTTISGQILEMANTTSKYINFSGSGVNAPTLTTRSSGTKIVLFPELSGTNVDYAIGIESSVLWNSVPTLASHSFKWYGGTTEMMRLSNRRLTLYRGTPTNAQGYHDNASFVIDSNGESFIQFRNTADDGKYQGLIYSDNNLGGYVVHGNGLSYDGLRIGGYSGISFDIGGEQSLTSLSLKTQRGTMNSDGNFYWFGQIHATRFVDRDNTSYYVDPASTSVMWNINLINLRLSLDRAWDNYPSITIYNTTDQGPQGEFRIHGVGGANGGDFSVVTRCDGGYVTGSDYRRKTNIQSIDNALERVMQLNGKTFNTITRDGRTETELSINGKKFGFIAQEAENIIPEAIQYYPNEDIINENGWASAYSIDYPSIVALLTEAIKELKQEFEDYKKTHP